MISVVEVFSRENFRRWYHRLVQWIGVVSLWLLVLVSALSVVHVTQQARKRANELEVLRTEQAELKIASGQYLLEQSAWSAYSRIESLAVTKLHMKMPAATDVIIVSQ